MIFWSISYSSQVSHAANITRQDRAGIPWNRSETPVAPVVLARGIGPMWWQDHLSEFVTLFLVINPFGSLPIFMALTEPFDLRKQRKIALTAVLIALYC